MGKREESIMHRVAVIGVGEIGKEHARIYASLRGVKLIGVSDLDPKRGQAVADRYGTEYVPDCRDLLGRVDAVSVAVPTERHCEIACRFLEEGVSVLVEKPMARTLEEADAMIRSAARSDVVLQVGHLERFNPSVRALSQIVREPRFFEVHRLGKFTERSLDIVVVLDLMIHDLDIILSLVGPDVASIRAVGIPILTDRIDIANARLEFPNGCVANVTASRISREKIRKLRLFQPNDYISLDYARQEVEVYSLAARHAPDGRPEIIGRSLPVQKYEPLCAQIESFLECVQEKKRPLVSGEDGRRALDLALRVISRIQEHLQKHRI